MPGMRKSKGSLLAEGLGALALFTLVLCQLLQGLPSLCRFMESCWTQGELDRLEQDLHTRLESRSFYEVEQVRVFQGDHGTEVRCYGRPDAAWESWFVITTAKRPWPTLYVKIWKPRKHNPVSLAVSPEHVQVENFSASLPEPGKLAWELTLRDRKTGQEKVWKEVLPYGR